MNNLVKKFNKYFFWFKVLFDRKKLSYLYLFNQLTPQYVDAYNWAKNEFSIPYPQFVKEKIFQKYNLENSIWVETGTHYGRTALYLSKIAKFVYTLEPSKKIFDEASIILNKFENIKIFNSSSEKGLNEILKELPSDSNICFWLDGHYSEGDTFMGEKVSPIIFELELIEKYYKEFKNFVILIDDFRLFKNYESENNYPNKNFLINWTNKNNLEYEVEADIFVIKNKLNI